MEVSRKRGPEPDESSADPAKKARSAELDDGVHVYQPNAGMPLEPKMNALLEVLLPAKYLTSDAKAVKLRQLWGTDTYTDDSDLVAVLVHTGHVKLKSAAPKTSLLVSLRICASQDSYVGTERNAIRSRGWEKEHPGVAFKIERCLQHAAAELPPPELSMLRAGPSRQIPGSLCPLAPGPSASFAVPPSARIVVFDLSSEPSYKYSLASVSDQVLRPPCLMIDAVV